MDYISMSDIRTKLLLGTSICAVAMMFVMAAGVDAFKTNTSVVEPGQIMGHVTVLAVHPDGSMYYSQGDNFIQDLGIDAALLNIFDGTNANGEFDCMRIGNGTATDQIALNEELPDLDITCDNQPGGNDNQVSNILTSPSGVGGTGSVDLVVQFAALTANDMNQPSSSNSITEALLMQDTTAASPGGGQTDSVVLSHVAITAVPVVEGTVVTLTYTMTLK